MKIDKILKLTLGSMFITTPILFAVETPDINVISDAKYDSKNSKINMIKVFGEELFNGDFSKLNIHRYNPNYILTTGDIIELKFWGAFDLKTKVTIDTQGNIFIPKVGVIHLLGVKNSELTRSIKKDVEKIYKKNVFMYASLDTFQPVSVFISGNVKNPGLYEGLSSNSILQFLDKSNGIKTKGSYRNIKINRNNKTILKVDLYTFLLSGKIDQFQFKNGDVISVPHIGKYITVNGDVEKKLQIEVKDLTMTDIKDIVNPNNTASNVRISSYNKNKNHIQMYNLSKDIKLKNKDVLTFVSNNTNDSLNIKIDGEHNNLNNIIVAKGTSLKSILDGLKINKLSSIENINLYRKSIAITEKALIDSSLNDLESRTLKTSSSTVAEAQLRNNDSKMILDFIKRAKKVEPKGRVIINKLTDLSKVILEEGDTLFIPKKSYVVSVQGEVNLPSSITYTNGSKIDDYLEYCGGLTDRADNSNILVIHQNGKVSTYNDSLFKFGHSSKTINPGDSILVLGKTETKNLILATEITQILYQIAISAGVLITRVGI